MKPTTWKQDPAAVTITSGAREQLVRVSDGTETYFAAFRRNRTVKGIAKAFAKGYAHGEAVNAVKITICRLVKGEWIAMGSASFDRRGVIGAAEVLRG